MRERECVAANRKGRKIETIQKPRPNPDTHSMCATKRQIGEAMKDSGKHTMREERVKKEKEKAGQVERGQQGYDRNKNTTNNI